MEWFRSYHGAPLDPKLAAVAKRANCRRGEVAAVWWCILDVASQCVTDRGDAASFDPESFAVALEFDVDVVERILRALRDKELLVGTRVAKWEKYQVKREDSSAERMRRHRQRVTQSDAERRDVTRGDHREEEIRVEKKERGKRVRAPKPSFEIDDDFQGWAKTECPLVPLDSLPTLLASYRDWQKNNGAPKDERAGFRNWCRRENKYAAERAAKALLADSKRRQPLPGDAPLMTYDEPWPQRLRSWRTGTPWNWAQWGPKPGEKGCRVPASLLEAA